MNNTEIAKKLTEIAQLLNIQGDKVYRIRAYQKAATALQNFSAKSCRNFIKKKNLCQKSRVLAEALKKKSLNFWKPAK